MHDKKMRHCKFKYPKNYVTESSKSINSYPIYRSEILTNILKLEVNILIIPYNPYSLAKLIVI